MTHHLALIDVLTDEEVLQAEQDVLDGFDEELVNLDVRIQQIIINCSPTTSANTQKTALKRLSRISKCIIDLKTNLGNVTDDICKVQQYQEQLADLKYMTSLTFVTH